MNTHDPRRRIILRGTLAAGAGLLLGACDSRQQSHVTPPATSPAPMSDAPPPPGPAPEAQAEAPPPKVSKAQVQYQTEPKGEQHCATCAQFEPETNTCKVVEGDISPDGWCLLWVARPGA